MTVPVQGTVTATDATGQSAQAPVTIQLADPVATRNYWLWPGSVGSFWNWPLGSGARFNPTQFWNTTTRDNLFAEVNVLGDTSPDAPPLDVYDFDKSIPDAWQTFGTSDPNPVKQSFRLRVAADYATTKTQVDATQDWPNAAGGLILESDPYSIREFNYGYVRPDNAHPYVLIGSIRGTFDLRGDGIPTSSNKGGHGGSMLSGYFGTIRIGELWGDDTTPIRHALKLNGFMRGYGVRQASGENAHMWPAWTHDKPGVIPGTYGSVTIPGCVSLLPMGALIAIPPSVDLAHVAFETDGIGGQGPARRVALAAQRFGIYLVDEVGSASWISQGLCVEWGCVKEGQDLHGVNIGGRRSGVYPNAFSRDMDKIISLCRWVENNGPTSIGGGGTPLYPLAPAL